MNIAPELHNLFFISFFLASLLLASYAEPQITRLAIEESKLYENNI